MGTFTSTVFNAIESCRICSSSQLEKVLDLGMQALSGRFPDANDPEPPAAPLALVRCSKCGLLQLEHTVPAHLLYADDYGYRSGINQIMRTHLKGIAQSAEKHVHLSSGDTVLDIGCNDGTLLKSYSVSGLKKVGIDPLVRLFQKDYPTDFVTREGVFTADRFKSATSEKAKVITSIAMFYDLENPGAFARDIASCLHPDGVWILEQSYMPTMLETNSFDTICHEHLEYYTLEQIDHLMKGADLRVVDVEFNDINGGSFRIYACHEQASQVSRLEILEKVRAREKGYQFETLVPFKEFTQRIEKMRKELSEMLTDFKARGKKVYVYGASTKGNVLLSYYGLDHRLIVAAAERNPKKYGRRTPGTKIPIISEEEARAAKPDYFLVLPWHFKSEFLERERAYLEGGGHLIFPLPQVEII